MKYGSIHFDFLKKITILDVIQMFGIAWSKVPESAMRNVWKKLMPSDDPIPKVLDSTLEYVLQRSN